MEEIETSKVSTKGQVVIPQTIRDRLGLVPGDKMVVTSERDMVIMRKLTLEDVIHEAELDRAFGRTISHEEMKERYG